MILPGWKQERIYSFRRKLQGILLKVYGNLYSYYYNGTKCFRYRNKRIIYRAPETMITNSENGEYGLDRLQKRIESYSFKANTKKAA